MESDAVVGGRVGVFAAGVGGELGGGHFGLALELTAKMRGVFEAKIGSDFFDGSALLQKFLGGANS
jgi:hypothetical protein